MAKSESIKPSLKTEPVVLKAPSTAKRDPEYRAFDNVVPESGKRQGSYIPPCVFGKKQKLAESCKVKLFFAGKDTAAELTEKTGRKYAPGAYLRVCGPKTNDTVEVLPAPDVEIAMRRAQNVCDCVESQTGDGGSCVSTAAALAGTPKRRRRRKVAP